MARLPSPIDFSLPKWTLALILYCACYTGIWGLWMLMDPNAYFDFAQMGPEHFPPNAAFWGWFGISGGFFYGIFPFIYRRAPYYAFGAALFSLAGVLITIYMLLFGPLTTEMGAIHLSGDVAGLIGFGLAAIRDRNARRNQSIGA